MRLRFQLPASVLPLTVERATLHLRVRAPSRRVAVAGVRRRPAGAVWPAWTSPADPIRVEVTDAATAHGPTTDGGLYLSVSIANVGPEPAPETPWRIDVLGLEVVGRTAGGP